MKGVHHRSAISKSVFIQRDSAEYHLGKSRLYWPALFTVLLILGLSGAHYSKTLKRISANQIIDNLHVAYLQSYSQYLLAEQQPVEKMLAINPMETLSVPPNNYVGEVEFYSIFKHLFLRKVRGWDKVWVFEPNQRLLAYFEVSCSQFFFIKNCNNEIIVTTLNLTHRSSGSKDIKPNFLVNMAEKVLSRKAFAVFELDYTVTKMVIRS